MSHTRHVPLEAQSNTAHTFRERTPTMTTPPPDYYTRYAQDRPGQDEQPSPLPSAQPQQPQAAPQPQQPPAPQAASQPQQPPAPQAAPQPQQPPAPQAAPQPQFAPQPQQPPAPQPQ